MRTYRIIANGRTALEFTDKVVAILRARDFFDCGFDDVYIAYGNGNPVPKTPAYSKMEERKLDKPYTIVIMEEKKPHREVRRFKADTIVCVRDKNGIDPDFYREFWADGEMIGRYSSKEFYFDFGADWLD